MYICKIKPNDVSRVKNEVFGIKCTKTQFPKNTAITITEVYAIAPVIQPNCESEKIP